MLGVRGFVFFALSVLSATGAFADPGKHVVLRSPQMGVLLSAGTGRVESIQDASGLVLLADNEDRYDLEGRPATEGQDQVVTARSDESTAQFDCRSAALGLNVRKVYRLRGSVLEKSATYTPEAGESRLLRIASRSRAAPALARDGCYYIPTDDGYKARALPFLPGPRITLPSPWTVSTGSFIYYLPKKGCVLTHYRYRINGEHFYGEADPEIESRFLPGGAITALGQAFVDRNTPLVLESRCALLQGDPRAWHRHIVGQPPYTAHRNDPVPAWFRKCRMFFGDGILGTGKGLVEEREAIGREVRSMLTFLREDESLMVFFNHWSTSGDYPSEGMVRPLDYRASQWGPPVPAARVRENIAWLKAISPRVKVGGYVFLGPAAGTEPYERHPEWFVYDRKGELRQGGDGVGPCAYPDFTTGYRDYSMNQMKRMVTDLGFDWIHMDCGPMEVVNWKARRAVQSSVSARFYEELAAYCAAHDKALVQNVAPLTVLWAHGGYFECQQPERWEKKDWRILGVHGHLDALARTLRPGVWTNLVYGTHREYGMRNAFSGMRGWIRSGLTWWRFIAHGFSYEDVVDELAGTRLVDATVHPSWWRLETDRLEAAVLRKGEAAIIPLLLHAEAPAQETISLNSAEVGCRPGQVLFSFDYRLPLPTGVDVFRPVPIQSEVIALTGFRATERPAGEYRHRLRLEPRRNAYHVLTQVPAWVASVGGRRACFLLPENLGVTLRGSLPTGADRYRVSVECGGKSAQILAHVPAAWPAADVRLNGRPTQAAPVDVAGRRCLRVDVPAGRSDIEVTRRPAPAPRAPAERYRGPLRDTWSETARRIFYTNLRPRAFSEEGRSCLALSSDSAGGGMANLPLVYGSEEAAGFAVTVKGANTGGRLVVELVAGDAWTHEIRDDFTGWRGFSVTREQMACKAATKKWAPVSAVRVYATPAAGKELTLANLRLLPARAQDRERKEVARKHLVATRAGAPPRLDGQPNDACWRAAPVATDFYGYSGNRISGSRTLVRACYDSENLYLFFDNLESIEDAGPLRERDAQIWSGDHVELYLDPNRGKGDWFQLLVDPAGTIQDVIYTATGRDFGWNGAFEVKTALNWKASWTAEFRVPFRILGRRPAMGDVWGINFARKDISGEFSNWAATREWLDPAGFGEVQFGGATAPAGGSAPASRQAGAAGARPAAGPTGGGAASAAGASDGAGAPVAGTSAGAGAAAPTAGAPVEAGGSTRASRPAAGGAPAAGGIQAEGARPGPDPNVLFSCSFDGTLVPEVQCGAGAFHAHGQPEFRPGRRGRALVLAHARGVRYPAAGNLQASAGTLRFWVMPVNWNRDQQFFHHFVTVPGPAGAPDPRVFHAILYKFRDWDEVLAYGLHPLLRGKGLLRVSMDASWLAGKWHQVVFTWDAAGVGLYVDGVGEERQYREKAPATLAAAYFNVGGPYFAANDALTALDDLVITRTKMTAEQVAALWRAQAP